MRNSVFGISDQVQLKLGFATTNDGLKLYISDLGSKWVVQSMYGLYSLCSENNGVGHLSGYRAASLCHYFCICKNRFSHDVAHMFH